MNAPFACRLPSLPGLGMALAVALLWCGQCEMQAAHSSFGNVDAPPPGMPAAPPWPVIDWGIEPAFPGGRMADQELNAGLKTNAGPAVLSLRSEEGDVVMNFGANQDLGLGPAVSVLAPPLAEPAENSGQAAGSIRLGNVTFNQTANSLNVGSRGDGITGDLSRQFQTETTDPNVAQSSPISGWAIAALAAIAVIIAMAIIYYENDTDDRKRRRSSRQSRRRHRRAN